MALQTTTTVCGEYFERATAYYLNKAVTNHTRNCQQCKDTK